MINWIELNTSHAHTKNYSMNYTFINEQWTQSEYLNWMHGCSTDIVRYWAATCQLNAASISKVINFYGSSLKIRKAINFFNLSAEIRSLSACSNHTHTAKYCGSPIHKWLSIFHGNEKPQWKLFILCQKMPPKKKNFTHKNIYNSQITQKKSPSNDNWRM